MDPFQSAPAITGGRSRARSALTSTWCCFNPRPPSLAGDPCMDAVIVRRVHVSIRARHHWRAIPSSKSTCATRLMFQSAPAITGGRSAPWLLMACCRGRFNPRPPSLAGDPPTIGAGALVQGVSIRARHHWRAIRRARCCARPYRSSFNPRPPSLAGDPSDSGKWCRAGIVSIRARHHWRAILAVLCRARAKVASFNPRPPSLAGDPSPRCWLGPWGICFNPRPPSLAGDPLNLQEADDPDAVSIRARHHWRAIQVILARGEFPQKFQSAPAITGGRSPPALWCPPHRRCFNPRPPSLAGDPDDS